jgi:hypothetical protein
MVRKLGVDDRRIVVSETAAAPSSSRDPQAIVFSRIITQKKSDWAGPRRSGRPIDLERRARFSRLVTP